MFRVNNKKKEKASGLFLACMPSKQHAPAPACHDKKQCRPYSYSRAGHAHVSAQPPLIGQWCEKKKRSHIRNVDGLHTSKVSNALWRSAGRQHWHEAIAGSPHVLLHLNMSWLRFTVSRTSLQSSRASQPAAALSGCHAVTRGLNANISLSRHPVWAHVLNTARVSPEATHTADAQYVYSCR